ncbi:MAG: hypothetical protein IPQ14_06335 [Candidatus Microthrix sp.]|nr:hypothetical protein [Candidatus Microthrix sp.]
MRRCWGDSFEGQLGSGNLSSSLDSHWLAGVPDAVSISAGYEHTCATLGTGGVRCWGYNDDGQVGDGTTTHRSQPVPVSNITNAVTVAAGRELSCAKLNSGQARCWGSNDEGRLGNGSPTISTTPVTVISGTCASAPDPGFQRRCPRRPLLRLGCPACKPHHRRYRTRQILAQRQSHTRINGRLPLDQRRTTHPHPTPQLLQRRPNRLLPQRRRLLAGPHRCHQRHRSRQIPPNA